MTISFKTDIVPLFTSVDIDHMSYAGVSLDDYAYMSRPGRRLPAVAAAGATDLRGRSHNGRRRSVRAGRKRRIPLAHRACMAERGAGKLHRERMRIRAGAEIVPFE